MKRITRYFFEGLLVTIPLVATIYVVYIVFIRIDSLFKFQIPGIGFIITLFAIFIIGVISSNFITSRLVRFIERLFTRLPLVKMIYTAIKDLIGAFVGDKKGFNRPVLVTLLPGTNIQAIGFVTRESLDHLGLSESVSVYLPQSYNFAGNLLVVPRTQITPLVVESGDLMAFIVSGGVSSK